MRDSTDDPAALRRRPAFQMIVGSAAFVAWSVPGSRWQKDLDLSSQTGAAIAVASSIALGLIVRYYQQQHEKTGGDVNSREDIREQETTTATAPPFRIIPRSEWGAKPPKSETPWNPADLFGVTVHWFGVPPAASSHDKCDDRVRGVQASHMAGEFSDIAYNHLFCPHGYAYEGRGFSRQTGANGTKYANRHYAAICFMGGNRAAAGVSDEDLLQELEHFAADRISACAATSILRERGLVTRAADPFPEIAQDVGAWLISEWFRRGTHDAVVRHNHWTGTDCPGPLVGDWVKSGAWRADLPTRTQVKFELWDDEQRVAESSTVPLAQEADRLSRFLDRVRGKMLDLLREEGKLGKVEVRRRLVE